MFSGQAQVPLLLHTRPAAAQSNSQQRPFWQLLPLAAHWEARLQPVLPRPIRLLQRPVLVLQPLPQVVVTKALLTQLRELFPWQLGGPPSHWTQPWPLARQIWPLQAPLQQTWPPAWVPSQALERQSPSPPQLWPSTLRHSPRMKTSLGLAHTQAPSVPHTRPDAAQFGVQQRLVLVTSAAQRLEAHWLLALQVWPLPSRPLHTPFAALQPLPQGVRTRALSSQRSETLPAHSEPAPSHWTHSEPSLAQKEPAQALAQQTLGPATVGAHDPVAQSAPFAQISPTTSRQAPLAS